MADSNDLFYNLSSAVNTTLNTNEYDSNDIEIIEPGKYIELNTEFEDENEANNAQNNLTDTNDTNTGIEVSVSRIEETQPPAESEPEPTTNVNVDMKITGTPTTLTIDFSAYIGNTIEYAQSDLNSNFSSLSPQFLINGNIQATSSNCSFDQEKLNYTPDTGGLNFWQPHNPSSEFKVVVDRAGTITLVYGCLWTAESVKVYKNNILEDETTTTKKTIIIDVNDGDEIIVKEELSVTALYFS